MFAVVVTFTIKSGQMADFMPLMLANAKASRDNEAGCRQFDVCTDPARPDQVFLYEIYDDAAAFDVHLAAPHFVEFAAATGDMLADKNIVTYTTVHQ